MDAMCMLGVITGIWVAGASTCFICILLSRSASGLPTRRGMVRSIAWPTALSALSLVIFLPTWLYGRHRVNSFVLGTLGALSVSLAQSAVSLAVLSSAATMCPLRARKTLRNKAVLLVPFAAMIVTAVGSLSTVGKDTLLFPHVVISVYVAAWASGLLQSIWTLSVGWGIRIADYKLTGKGKQRSLPQPKQVGAVDMNLNPQDENASESDSHVSL